MADFLNQSNSIFTSARDDGTGKPVTDVELVNELPAGSQIIGQIKLTDGTNGIVVNNDGSLNVQFSSAIDINSIPSLMPGDNTIGRVKLTDGTNLAAINTAGAFQFVPVDQTGEEIFAQWNPAHVTVSNLPNTQEVTGTVQVENFPEVLNVAFPSLQPVSDTNVRTELQEVNDKLNEIYSLDEDANGNRVAIYSELLGVKNALDQLTNMESYGKTINERPSANSVPIGHVYMAVDTGDMWQSNGTDWVVF